MNQTDPNINGILSSIRILLITIGGVMAGAGLSNTSTYKWTMIAGGAVTVLGPAIWGVWSSFVNFRRAQAVGVQAGINMTLQKKALAADGTTIMELDGGTTPPKSVTLATSGQIIKDFAPAANTIAKV